MQVTKDQNCFSMFFPISLLLPLSDYPLANFHLAAASLVFDESNHEDSGKVHHSHFLPPSFLWLCLESAPKYNSSCHFRADAASAAMGNSSLQGSSQSLLEWRCSVGPCVEGQHSPRAGRSSVMFSVASSSESSVATTLYLLLLCLFSTCGTCSAASLSAARSKSC